MAKTLLITTFFFISLGINAQWTPLNGPFNNKNSNDSRFMAIDNNNIFVAVSGSKGVFKTSDNGMHWQEFNIGLPLNAVGGIGIQTMSIIADNIFIYSGQGVYRSNVNNCNWILLSTPFYNNYFSKMYTNGVQIFASTLQGLYVSSDNGNSWVINSHFGTNHISAICYEIGVLYVVHRNSSFVNVFSKSNDNGLTWIDITNGLPTGIINNLIVSNNKIFISAKNSINSYTGGVYKSNIDGINWSLLLTSGNSFELNSLFKSGAKIIVLGQVDKKVTDNEGLTWTDLPPLFSMLPNCGYSSNNRVVIGEYGGCTNCFTPIYFSSDSGSTFSTINNNIVNSNIENIEIFNNKIVAERLSSPNRLYSNDNGFDWNATYGHQNLSSNGTSLFSIGSIYSQSSSLTTNTLYNSLDGMTWNTLSIVNLPQTCNGSSITSPNPCAAGNYKLLKTNGNEIYVGAKYYNPQSENYIDYRVYKTIDNGITWSLFSSGNGEIIDLVIGNNGLKYAIGVNKLWITSDDGLNWINKTPSNLTNRINCIAVENNTIYLGTGIWGGTPTSQGIFKSIDGGLNWVFVNNGLSTTLIKQIAVHSNSLFAVTTNYNNSVGHIFMSNNNGVIWTEVSSTELNNAVPHKLIFNNNNIYCATETNGIWKNSLSTLSIDSNMNEVYLEEIKLYPNPTNSNFYIDCSNLSNWLGSSINIRNILGQQIVTSKLIESKQSISLEGNPKGIYFVSIYNANNTLVDTKKIIYK